MRIESPTLWLDEQASKKAISRAVIDLKGKANPFLILSRDSMTYMQTLWTADGFILEHQDESISEHYVGDNFLSADAVTIALTEYLNGNGKWRSICSFHNKGIAGPTWSFGYFLGRLTGNISVCIGCQGRLSALPSSLRHTGKGTPIVPIGQLWYFTAKVVEVVPTCLAGGGHRWEKEIPLIKRGAGNIVPAPMYKKTMNSSSRIVQMIRPKLRAGLFFRAARTVISTLYR